MDINKKALQIFKENLSKESKDIKVELSDALSDLDINSITFIQIIVALESEFDFEFEDEKLLFTAFPQVKDMIDYVVKRTDGEPNGC